MSRPNPRNTNGHRRKQTIARVYAAYDDCHICGLPVDKSLPTPDPWSKECDEIIPVSKGGSPTDFSNCRLAHRWCNQQRGNRSLAWARTHVRPKARARFGLKTPEAPTPPRKPISFTDF